MLLHSFLALCALLGQENQTNIYIITYSIYDLHFFSKKDEKHYKLTAIERPNSD